ncbi:hypothetical protein DFH09DRAFT_1092328 [Mycena vulgaris]|nr:hypothetical protein DFH09DRAFT_1092328 [Mycena vulgaris]
MENELRVSRHIYDAQLLKTLRDSATRMGRTRKRVLPPSKAPNCRKRSSREEEEFSVDETKGEYTMKKGSMPGEYEEFCTPSARCRGNVVRWCTREITKVHCWTALAHTMSVRDKEDDPFGPVGTCLQDKQNRCAERENVNQNGRGGCVEQTEFGCQRMRRRKCSDDELVQYCEYGEQIPGAPCERDMYLFTELPLRIRGSSARYLLLDN